MADYKTSKEVAEKFGIDTSGLLVYIHRHPELRPNEKWGTAHMWTPEEIERLAAHRMRPISRGPKSTGGQGDSKV